MYMYMYVTTTVAPLLLLLGAAIDLAHTAEFPHYFERCSCASCLRSQVHTPLA